tara:strand:- start:995 stop:1750 length:756 start_codon:yes stop_codon:yes gene_type:complete
MANPVQKVPSRQNLRNTLGLAREFGFLEFNTLDQTVVFDDFVGDVLSVEWQTADTGSSASADAVISAGTNGTIVMVTGTADNGFSAISRELNFNGELNCVMAARIAVNDIADVKIEVGFTDAHDDAGAVSTLGSYSTTATDWVGWILDTDDTAYWQATGVDTNTEATKIEPSIAPVNDTYETLIVALEDTTAHFFRLDSDGYQTYSSAPMTGACTKDVNLTPWVMVQSREAGDSKTLTVDYIKAWQRRTAS